uniref:Uncharacterized protein n=1 Tax=Timema genevievae TaxID=629358 RepID=A0A7R9K9C1_TIMGE|nr:unnamed protein product [Timema genevievae]
MPVVIENVRFYQVLEITEKESLGFTLSIQKGTGDFEIFENKRPLVTGQIRIPENAAAEFSKNISVPSEDSTNLTGEDVYSELNHRGYHYSGQFKGILNAQIGNEGSTAVIEWSNDWLLFLEALIQLAILHKGEDSQQMQLPLSFQKVIIDPSRHPVEHGKSTLSTPNQDSNVDFPIIGNLVYCESSVLDHATTEAGYV